MSAYDVIVIGGGVIGTSCAYHLVKKGYKVALIEKGDIASGTSSHCDAAAMITDKMPGADAALGYASIQKFIRLSKELDYDFNFDQSGSLYVCETDQEVEVATGYVNALRAEGYRVKMVDPYEMSQIEPLLAKDLKGGFWSDECAGLNPLKLCYAFVEQVKGKGLDVFLHTKVTGVRLNEKHQVEGVDTDKGSFTTGRVINCGGVYAPEIGRLNGLNIPILPRKGVILLSEATGPVCHQKVQEFGYMVTKFANVECDRDPELLKYNVAFTLEPTEGDNVMLGSSRNFVGYNLNTEIEVINAIAKRGMRFFPILKNMSCVRAYAGVRPFVEDHLPIMSEVEEMPGYYICAGHEGDGISMSPVSGQLMTQLIAGEETELDMEPFRFSRIENRFLD